MRDNRDTLVVEIDHAQRGDIRPTLCVLSGREPGRNYPLPSGSTVVGRSAGASIVLDSDGVSRRHAALVHHGGRVEIVDLGSTNGTHVNGEPVDQRGRMLAEGDRVQVGDAVFKFTYQDRLEAEMQHSLYTSAVRDRLTGAYNRAFFNERWAQAFSDSLRSKTPLSLILLDLDHFKQLNDTYGHVAGDAVLEAAARAMQRNVRLEDTLARYGGEEFVVVLPGATLREALAVAERLRRGVAEIAVPIGGHQLAVTVSVGVSTRRRTRPDTPGAMLARADALLYEAKSAGRNCARPDRAA